MAQAQDFKNHMRVFPAYHVGVFFPLLVNAGWWGYRFFQTGSGDALVALVLGLALLLMFFAVRVQILTVQDRVIRLEMQLRLRTLLPAEMADRAAKLSIKQLIALRFAGDAELAALVQEVLDGRLTEQKAIKQAVKDWQADHLRA